MENKIFDWFVIWFFIISACILFYQGWMNIVHKNLTRFSFDALMLIYLRIFRGKTAVVNMKKIFTKEPKRIQTLGIFAVCGAFGAIYIALDWYLQYLR